MATVDGSRLAVPKPLPASFVEDRRSVYWDNGFDPKDFKKTQTFVMTDRQNALVYNKRTHPDYQPDRPSPIWVPSQCALTAIPSRRLLELSRPKGYHPDFRPDKMVLTKIPTAALLCHPSPRLHQLARHKTYPPLSPKLREDADWQSWVSGLMPELIPPATPRVTSLAQPKLPSELYMPPKPCMWPVSREAQNCVATERLHQLARPKNRHPEAEDYDPHTWTVSRSALLAQASPRIEELATPIPRKVRSKK